MVEEDILSQLPSYCQHMYGLADAMCAETKAKLWARRTYEWGGIANGRDVPWIQPYKAFMSKPGPPRRGHAH